MLETTIHMIAVIETPASIKSTAIVITKAISVTPLSLLLLFNIPLSPYL